MATLTDIQQNIEERLKELRPLVEEHALLTRVDAKFTEDFGPLPKAKERSKKSEPKQRVRGYSKGERKAAIAQARKTSIKVSAKTYGIGESTIRGWLKAQKT